MQVITEEQYQAWYDTMGRKYYISPRVIRFIRNFYKTKCPDMPYLEARQEMVAWCKGQVVDINRTFRAIQLETIHHLSRKITGLDISNRAINVIEANVKQARGHMDRIGYRSSTIKFLCRRRSPEKNEEILKDIIETVISPE